MASQCDLCAFYFLFEEVGTGEVEVNLDDDDLASMLSCASYRFPYFQMAD